MNWLLALSAVLVFILVIIALAFVAHSIEDFPKQSERRLNKALGLYKRGRITRRQYQDIQKEENEKLRELLRKGF